jgi:hypothetical protein
VRSGELRAAMSPTEITAAATDTAPSAIAGTARRVDLLDDGQLVVTMAAPATAASAAVASSAPAATVRADAWPYVGCSAQWLSASR